MFKYNFSFQSEPQVPSMCEYNNYGIWDHSLVTSRKFDPQLTPLPLCHAKMAVLLKSLCLSSRKWITPKKLNDVINECSLMFINCFSFVTLIQKIFFFILLKKLSLS